MAYIIRSAQVDNHSRHLLPSRAEKKTVQANKPISEPVQPEIKKQAADRLLGERHSSSDDEMKNDLQQSELIRSLNQQLLAAEERAKTAEAKLSQLEANLQEAFEHAHKSGFDTGSLKATEQLSEENTELKLAMQEIIKRLTSEYEEKLLDLEGDMLEVIYASVAKVIGDSIKDPAYIISCIQQVTAQFLQQNSFRVHLAPRDYEWLQKQGTFLSDKQHSGEIHFIPDDRIQYGGCIVESNNGGRDARLEVQLQTLKAVLLNTYRQQKE